MSLFTLRCTSKNVPMEVFIKVRGCRRSGASWVIIIVIRTLHSRASSVSLLISANKANNKDIRPTTTTTNPHHPRITTTMKRITQSHSLENFSSLSISRTFRISPFPSCQRYSQRCLHTTPSIPASVAPITAAGPPPNAPVPSAEHVDSRVARRRKQAELLKRGQDMRAVAAGTGGGTAKSKRFWKDVHVKKVDGEWTSH